MNAKQVERLNALLDEYVHNVPDQLAAVRQDEIRKAGKDIFFAWAGGPNRRDPHYYRIQSPLFLIEYDNTQNGANHIHSVWRDLNGDFGEDILKEHYEQSHKKQ